MSEFRDNKYDDCVSHDVERLGSLWISGKDLLRNMHFVTKIISAKFLLMTTKAETFAQK